MYSKSMMGKILQVLIVVVLTGCSAAPSATPTPVPTIDLKPTFDAVAAQAVQTMIANLTLNAPTATPIIPTDTPAPTVTVPLLPTDTPAPSATPTRVFIPWTKTPTATQPVYNCTVTSVSPTTKDTITVDKDFDGKWTVKNSGVKTWYSDNTDIRFVEGTELQESGDLVDLDSDVAPNGTYTIVVDMKAPSSDGTYTTTWGIYLEDGTVCPLTITINVTN
jgi:hypothetical protein